MTGPAKINHVSAKKSPIFKSGARWPAAPGFLELLLSANFSMCVCVCVCVSAPRLSITSGMMWCDIDPIRLVE